MMKDLRLADIAARSDENPAERLFFVIAPASWLSCHTTLAILQNSEYEVHERIAIGLLFMNIVDSGANLYSMEYN
jgi:hypothetical protein